MLSAITKPIKMLGIKRRLTKLVKEHGKLSSVDDVTNNETIQTILKDEYIRLGGKRFWDDLA